MKYYILFFLFCSLQISNAQGRDFDWNSNSKSINGRFWTCKISGRFSNTDIYGVKPVEGIIKKSEATDACKAIGGRLPPYSLFKQFKINDFHFIPGAKYYEHYWTATVAEDQEEAISYIDPYGATFDSRETRQLICCIKD